ncbi:hypothetical protein E7W39_00755 [Cronobacter sakazakii]|nr:hypothetical protein [Salmonella enterica]EGZ6860472.1 hypothetical protein [Cronobacter sakazakii]NCH54171.1 hypothetical protein [Cronobacter muytjensii]EGZ6869859.1 hypothetical protein [Cronobacter sakazakii]KAB0805866.1 hypothetical protein FZI15_21215 [Cronobacter sakazakii]
MRKGCFGSLIAASETGRACSMCPEKPACHAAAREVAISLYGKFVGFPNDKIKKTRKVKTHEGSNGQN